MTTSSLLIIIAGVLWGTMGLFVHTLTDSVPEQKFSKQPVTIGMSDGIRIEIKQGLQKGQQVRGAQKGI